MYINRIVKIWSDDVKMDVIGCLYVLIDIINDCDEFFNRCCFMMCFSNYYI